MIYTINMTRNIYITSNDKVDHFTAVIGHISKNQLIHSGWLSNVCTFNSVAMLLIKNQIMCSP